MPPSLEAFGPPRGPHNAAGGIEPRGPGERTDPLGFHSTTFHFSQAWRDRAARRQHDNGRKPGKGSRGQTFLTTRQHRRRTMRRTRSGSMKEGPPTRGKAGQGSTAARASARKTNGKPVLTGRGAADREKQERPRHDTARHKTDRRGGQIGRGRGEPQQRTARQDRPGGGAAPLPPDPHPLSVRVERQGMGGVSRWHGAWERCAKGPDTEGRAAEPQRQREPSGHREADGPTGDATDTPCRGQGNPVRVGIIASVRASGASFR